MKALSIQNPWAQLIADGFKRIEVRTWSTDYRGPLLICSSRRSSKKENNAILERLVEMGYELADDYFVDGHALAVVELTKVRPLKAKDAKKAMLDTTELEGKYAWVMKKIKMLETPFPVQGRSKLFEVETPEDMVLIKTPKR